jgi:hypothetical protein
MKLNNKPKRAWINQPSENQPLHRLHGQNVLAIREREGIARVYPTSGQVESLEVLENCLSSGWNQ